ncbi:MAG: DMT family transporter [Acidimicrobiales bacterium]
MGSWLGYLLVCIAATVNAVSNILQRAANRRGSEESVRLKTILSLAKRPDWIAGVGCVIVSFVLLATALDIGRLAAIQPIVVLELPLTLIMATKIFGSHLSKRDWAAVLTMSGALAGLIGSLDPHGGSGAAALKGPVLAIAIGGTVVLIAIVTAVGLMSHSVRRAAFLGVATGLTFGLTSGFMKAMTFGLHAGAVGIFTSWATYAMVVSGLTGMYLLQSALRAGQLVAAQPGITLLDPAVAILWGVFVFHESTRSGAFVILAVISALAIGIATSVLAHSQALHDVHGKHSAASVGPRRWTCGGDVDVDAPASPKPDLSSLGQHRTSGEASPHHG